MTPRQSFKAAFLHRCADEGLSLEETHARVKQALLGAGGPGTGLVLGGLGGANAGGPGGAVLGGMAGHAYDKDPTGALKMLMIGGLAIPAGVGILGGKMLAEAKKDPLTVDEARTNEELAELQRLTDRANRVRQLRTPGATV
jgi:hypothetical protein